MTKGGGCAFGRILIPPGVTVRLDFASSDLPGQTGQHDLEVHKHRVLLSPGLRCFFVKGGDGGQDGSTDQLVRRLTVRRVQ